MFVGLAMGYSQGSVKGLVLSENKKGKLDPVPFATVYWQGTNIGTSTDSNGVFQLAISPDSKTLIGSFVGYQSDTLKVKNFDEVISVVLKESIQLKTVEVVARQQTSQMSFINPIQLENISERELFKAACCNLSESFETNPSVDVNFTDAITGTKQIHLLGLAGPYTSITRENMPGMRGLANNIGLSFIPGSWVSSIQVSKGTGSVVNGYESMVGQINTELKKPDEGQQTFFNVYGNQSGRTEANLVQTIPINKNWGTTLLLHGNTRPFERDNNEDGFMDFPLQDQVNLMNRWKFDNKKGWMGQFGVQYIQDEKNGGQSNDKIEEEEKADVNFKPYEVSIKTNRLMAFGKMGYVFNGSKFKSVGLQLSASKHEQDSHFGIRNYGGTQSSLYANLIYQSIIVNSFHQFKTGLTYQLDDFEEASESIYSKRKEEVPGAFFEYSFIPSNLFTAVVGLRYDFHSIFGEQFTPRLHLRYAPTENAVIRAAAGLGRRSPLPLVDKQALLATSRTFQFLGTAKNNPFNLRQEKAWNFGLNYTQSFKIDYREAQLNIDAYHTQFREQMVVDVDYYTQTALFYNLAGYSYSTSAQVELNYELIKFLDWRVAYRFTQVETDFKSGRLQNALTPKHRIFSNWAYNTKKNVKKANWAFDLTLQILGPKRLPNTSYNPAQYQREEKSPLFWVVERTSESEF